MAESLSTIPEGIRYYFGQEAYLRRAVEQTAMTVFDGWSYEEITTPTVDYYTLFERGMGASEAQRAFRFTDSDGRMLALRGDVTSGIARAAATLMAARERPLRFCYAAPVFHQRPASHAEWRRESTQIGCELIGRDGIAADLEVVAIASEILTTLGLEGRYVITLNQLGIFNGIVETLNLDPGLREEMRQLVDVRNETDLKRFFIANASGADYEMLVRLVQLSGKGEVFAEARALRPNEQSLAALDRLETFWRIIEALGLTDHFELDLGDVSRLDYYTGLVFKIYVTGAGVRVGSGGRYDRLTGNFGKPEPAVGFVLELDPLAETLAAGNGWKLPAIEVAKAAHSISGDDSINVFREALNLRKQSERVRVSFKVR
jgi:ATP phosphoribosyltransferase regulatory subunit